MDSPGGGGLYRPRHKLGFTATEEEENLHTLDCLLHLRSSGMLCTGISVDIDVSGQPIGPIFNGHAVQGACRNTGAPLYIVNSVGNDWFSENVTLSNGVTGACRIRNGGRGKRAAYGVL
jgi:hypothetical protein